ncbi:MULTISPECIES: class I SAM-dependent rRNA methyltransferase [Muribaculum]|jgi:23S rRNA (cytosine1962-C5)-methyltransferase|uniref:Class I SAM-dependent rRNA methyltransferase n=3 Tax=Muribaculum TaxID=1918540 RepID=A0AC61S7J7_9BACT|nr:MULTISPECIES: class I SAM-dependent rRNA methyltransferase [Muribaculum]THG54493.1 class I SAM-dependent rRNA methyltransferase [Muribaculum caecicola]
MNILYPKIYLRKGKEQSLDRFHPWVFSGAVANMPQNIDEGDLVSVLSADGRTLGVGHYQVGSIAVRILAWGEKVIDKNFFSTRLNEAFRMRKALNLIREDNNAYRLVHGEGDFLPGLIVDIYADTAVIQAHSPGMHFCRMTIAECLTSINGLNIKNVYYKSETTLPYKANLDQQNDYIIGSYTTNIAIENGMKFHVDWLRGQKTGFFVDQRDNRSLLEHYSSGRKVLNMFCYTGGFSVAALRGGAELVHSVDSSAKAVALTDDNVAINFPDTDRHKAFAEDAFKFISNIEKDSYNLIILDPPAFAKHRDALKNALIGYRKLNARAMEKIAPGGLLFTFSCSQAVSREQFRLAVFSAATMARRRVRILHQLTQPADHPVNICHPEGEYLKGLILYIE